MRLETKSNWNIELAAFPYILSYKAFYKNASEGKITDHNTIYALTFLFVFESLREFSNGWYFEIWYRSTIFKIILIVVAFYYFCSNIYFLFIDISRKPLYDNTVIIRYEKGATDLFYFSHSNTHVRSFICISYNIWMSYLSSEKYPFDFQLNLESLLIHSIYYSASVNEHAYILNFKEIFRVTFNCYLFQEENSLNIYNLWCLIYIVWYNMHRDTFHHVDIYNYSNEQI